MNENSLVSDFLLTFERVLDDFPRVLLIFAEFCLFQEAR